MTTTTTTIDMTTLDQEYIDRFTKNIDTIVSGYKALTSEEDKAIMRQKIENVIDPMEATIELNILVIEQKEDEIERLHNSVSLFQELVGKLRRVL